MKFGDNSTTKLVDISNNDATESVVSIDVAKWREEIKYASRDEGGEVIRGFFCTRLLFERERKKRKGTLEICWVCILLGDHYDSGKKIDCSMPLRIFLRLPLCTRRLAEIHCYVFDNDGQKYSYNKRVKIAIFSVIDGRIMVHYT
ncbi:hypothetical protein WN55_11047 [Dufourea novaeangliae]|uniref:Uncharacterized protein n=1 Tax=Dufourea novaeangliae TaxID=178035 RepID=A0A154PBX9_DUFNO|nr:hypothetical protein WN55_11047 [Dufourea novaeangliae]